MTHPSLEIHVPISPTPRFFNMIRCLAGSLRTFGGAYRDAPLVVTIGDHEIAPEVSKQSWMRDLGIEARWVPRHLFREESWFATGLERFRYPFSSDVVLMLDADVLICAPFEDMVFEAHRAQSFAGLIAHFSPFVTDELRARETALWQELFHRGEAGELHRPHRYTGARESEPCPPYFNFGVLCAPGRVMNQIGDVIYSLVREVDQVLATHFRCQIALTLAIAKLSIPYRTLPPRDNFPTDRDFERLYPEEAGRVRLLHLLGEKELAKRNLFADVRNLHAAVRRRDLTGADETARRVLESVVWQPEAAPGAVVGGQVNVRRRAIARNRRAFRARSRWRRSIRA